VEIRLVDLEQ